MSFSFRTFKDRSSGVFGVLLGIIARAPKGVRGLAYGCLLFISRLLYFLPFSYLRRVANHWSIQLGGKVAGRDLYFGLTACIIRMVRTFQAMTRPNQGEKLPGFRFMGSAQSVLEAHKSNGAILIMPHATGALLAANELAKSYDILMLVKQPKDPRRAAKQQAFYETLACETLDARRTDPVTLARSLMKAFKSKRMVIGTCDRIMGRPRGGLDYRKETDTVLCHLLGQGIGVVGWPARFAHKCGIPMIPLMPIFEKDCVELYLAEPITATGDINVDSQAWLDALWALFKEHPEHWMFVYDKRWAQLLLEASKSPAP